MRDKRGLSTIVTTLIIIVLVLVAIGIVWAVVRNVIQTGSGTLDISAKCLNIDVRASQANCSDGTPNKICQVTLVRTGTGNDVIAGVKLVFRNTTSAKVYDAEGNIEPVAGRVLTNVPTGILSATFISKVEATVYFEDESGVAKYCSQTTSFTF